MIIIQKQLGTTFLELLISITLFSFAIIAVMRLQWFSLQEMDFNEQVTIAQIQLDSISDQIFIHSAAIADVIELSKYLLKRLLPRSELDIIESSPAEIRISLKHRHFHDTQLTQKVSI